MCISYVDGSGNETSCTADTPITIVQATGNNNITITSPAPASGMVGYNVYVIGVHTATAATALIQSGSSQNATPIPIGTDWVGSPYGIAQTWTLAHNHFPNPAYVPYIATDDPYYLEEVQHEANFSPMWSNSGPPLTLH